MFRPKTCPRCDAPLVYQSRWFGLVRRSPSHCEQCRVKLLFDTAGGVYSHEAPPPAVEPRPVASPTAGITCSARSYTSEHGSAGSLEQPNGMTGEFDVLPVIVQGMECTCLDNLGPNCCPDVPGLYQMSAMSFANPAVIGEGEVAMGHWAGHDFSLFNLGSHVHRDCINRRHHDWVLTRPPAG